MMLRLPYSGYDQKFRTEVVRSALKAYNRLIELDASGEQPLYRPRELKRLERAESVRINQVPEGSVDQHERRVELFPDPTSGCHAIMILR